MLHSTIGTLILQGLETALTYICVTPVVTSLLYFLDTSEYYNEYGPRIIKPRTNVLGVICVA